MKGRRKEGWQAAEGRWQGAGGEGSEAEVAGDR